MDGIQPLVYVELNAMQKEVLIEDDTKVDDVGVIEEFNTWWSIELEEGDGDMEGRCIHKCIDIVEDVATIAGEIAAGEGEEVMMDALKELILGDRAMSFIDEGVSPSISGDDTNDEVGANDIPATQIPKIDSLLDDIYEL